MAFTLDPTTEIGYIRERIGDVIASEQSWSDESIQARIDRLGSVDAALRSFWVDIGTTETLAQAAQARREQSSAATSFTVAALWQDAVAVKEEEAEFG